MKNNIIIYQFFSIKEKENIEKRKENMLNVIWR